MVARSASVGGGAGFAVSKSGMPLFIVARWYTVTRRTSGPHSSSLDEKLSDGSLAFIALSIGSTYRGMLSLRLSLPACASCRIAAPVDILVIEPHTKMSSTVVADAAGSSDTLPPAAATRRARVSLYTAAAIEQLYLRDCSATMVARATCSAAPCGALEVESMTQSCGLDTCVRVLRAESRGPGVTWRRQQSRFQHSSTNHSVKTLCCHISKLEWPRDAQRDITRDHVVLLSLAAARCHCARYCLASRHDDGVRTGGGRTGGSRACRRREATAERGPRQGR
eukprot:2142325-Prymnesium_polylepis.2